MSRRGEITIECANPSCHGELVIDTNSEWLRMRGLEALLRDQGWQHNEAGDICPDCCEESDNPRDEAYERAAAKARSNDFADTAGRDWT